MTENAAHKFFIVVALSVMLVWTLMPLDASGQAATSPGAVSGLATSFSTFDAVTDVIACNNSRGPYLLSLRKIQQGSESVVVTGELMRREEDYTIDYETGAVSLMNAAPAGSLIRVCYRQRPGVSEKNDGAVAVPIKLDLSQSERGGLSILGLYKQDQRAARLEANTPGIGIFGISGSRKWGKSAETSTLFLTGPGGNGDEGFWSRSALKFGTAGDTGRMSFRASFQRAGEDFAGAKEYSLQKGKEVADVAIGFNPSSRLSAGSSFKRTEDLGGVKQGTAVVTTEHNITYSPSKVSKITASHAARNLDTPDGEQSSSTVDRLQVEQQFGMGEAVASIEEASMESADGKDKMSAQRLAVNASPTEAIKIKASVARESYASKGDDTSTAVQVVANPVKRVGVRVDYSARESDFAADEEAHKVSIEAQPAGFVKVSAGVGEHLSGDNRDVSKEARIEIEPYKRARIVGKYVYAGSGVDEKATTEVIATSKPINFLEFSGRYKIREGNLVQNPDTLGVEVSLKPIRYFSLVGKYARNPEDRVGGLLLQDQRSLGLRTRIGSFGFSGGLSINQNFAAGWQTETRELGMSLKMFGHGELITGYKETLTIGSFPCGLREYTLGYTHKAGQNLNLTLAGTMTEYESQAAGSSSANDRTEYEAQAKLGVRF